MQSGIGIPDAVRDEFQAIRMKRAYRYVIYKANDDKSAIEVEKCGARDETFEQFKESMPKDRSR